MREDVVRDKKLINNAKVQFHRPLFIDKWSFLVHEGISDTQRDRRESHLKKKRGGGWIRFRNDGRIGWKTRKCVCKPEKPGYKVE
jgi:hypothetical protein